MVEELARDYAGKVKVAKMNVDENAKTPAKYGIRAIPTLIIFKAVRWWSRSPGSLPLHYRKRLEKSPVALGAHVCLDYDLIIIGGGPAGLTAGIYAGRARLCALLLEKLIHGGQMMTTDLIENYPGFPEGITGFELSDRMRKQAERFKLLIKDGEVLEIIPGKPLHTVVLEDRRVTTPAIVIALRGQIQALRGPGEDKLAGHGVSFCATCDGALYRGHEIAMVGGGDNALTEVLFLERFAKKIHLIHRRDQFRGCKYLQERVLEMEKVQVHLDTVVTECKGQSELEALELRNVKTGELSTLPVTGVLHRHRHGTQYWLAKESPPLG